MRSKLRSSLITKESPIIEGEGVEILLTNLSLAFQISHSHEFIFKL